MKDTLRTLFILSLATLSACSYLFDSAPRGTTSKRGDLIAQAPLVTKKSIGLEVTWEVPTDPIDGFVLRYGPEKENLSHEVTVFLSQLRREDDIQYGPVYRYTITDIKESAPLFVSVAAFKGDVLSNFSDIISETPQ